MNELSCNIVQDLLPNYIEKLTSDETNNAIDHHLSSCENCIKIYDQMTTDIEAIEKVPTIELRFLKKVKRTKLFAALLTIAITLSLSYYIYYSEYKYTNDKSSLAVAITEFTSPFNNAVDAYVLETEEIDDVLVASFKDAARANVNGVAVLYKGFNQRYRIISARIETSEYSSVIQIHRIRIKDAPYYVVSGYNLSDEINHYGLDYDTYLHPGTLSKDRVRESIKFEVENQQFMKVYTLEEMESLLRDSVDYTYYDANLWETSMYDADGQDITESFKIQEGTYGPKGSTGKAELFLINVFIVIVLGIGVIITRYFLTE